MALNKDRLKELSKVLKGVKLSKATKFNMGLFIEKFVDKVPETETVIGKDGKVKVVTLKEGFCSTSACVLGFAALHEPFNKKGLKVELQSELDTSYEGEGVEGEVVFKDFGGFEAGEHFFGLTEAQGNALFDGPWKKPADAAAFIDRILAGKLTKKDEQLLSRE